MNFEPRPYQEEAVERVIEGWKTHQRQLIVLPTGAGKTCVFAMLAERTPGKTLVLAHRDELLDQAIAKIHNVTGLVADKEKASAVASRGSRIVVASIQSMVKRLDKWRRDHFELVVCDEAHHSISNSWRKVIRHFADYANVLGVTATADRSDKRNLGEMYQHVAHEVFLDDLIRQGYLSPIKIRTVPIKINLDGCARRAGDFAAEDVGHAVEPYLPAIAEAIKAEASDRRVLTFLPLVATSHKFCHAARDVGLRVAHIDGKSKDRREILQAFADGEYDVLSNAMLLTEGFDDPGIGCVVNLRATQSRSLYTQIIGRGTRLAPGKDSLLVLDFLWQHTKHKLIKPAHLSRLPQEVIDEMVLMSEEAAERAAGGEPETFELFELESQAQIQREAKLARILDENATKEAAFIDFVETCKKYGAEDALDFFPRHRWQAEPPTPKQVAILERAGLDPQCVTGKGQAARLIDAYMSHVNNRPASDKQKAAMRRRGFDGWETATVGQAKQFFASRGR